MRTLLRFTLSLGLITISALRAGALSNGSQTCPASGAKVLSTTNHSKYAWIQFFTPSGNSGQVYLGGSTVSSTTAAGISANQSWLFPVIANTQPYDLTQTYMACSNSADSLQYTVFQ